MKIKLLNLISAFGFLTMLRFWIKEINLRNEVEEVLLNKKGWLTKEYFDATFGLLYHNIWAFIPQHLKIC